MSEYVPFEIQIEIIKKLPIKPLVQFRSVSKSWKSVIDSSEFIANYHFNNDRLQHRVLVSYSDYNDTVEERLKYVSIADDDSFPRHKFPLIVPSCVRQLVGDDNPSILGSSQGVFCLCVNLRDYTYWYDLANKAKTFVLWNPTIQKSVRVVVPSGENDMNFKSVVGFGVCPRTSVPKLVKITYIADLNDIDNDNLSPQVEIFSLSSGSCTRSLSMNVPRKSIELGRNHVCVDKCIYWFASDRTFVTGETYRKKDLILSFDMTTEEFTEIDLCDGLKEEKSSRSFSSLSRLGTSLVVLQLTNVYTNNEYYSVWRMEHGVPNTFTKLFVIKSSIESLQIHMVHDFRKTGELIIDTEMTIDKKYIQNTVVYEPKSGEMSDIAIDCHYDSLVKSYIETLLLLDHSSGEYRFHNMKAIERNG